MSQVVMYLNLLDGLDWLLLYENRNFSEPSTEILRNKKIYKRENNRRFVLGEI